MNAHRLTIGAAFGVLTLAILALLVADANQGTEVDNRVMLLLLMPFAYVLPSAIAEFRHVRDSNSVLVINLLLGWTVVGWVVALAMAVRTVDDDDWSHENH